MTQDSFTYKVGDSDQRPWGAYEVTAIGSLEGGEEYCEKLITVHPGQILSLQSHQMRREMWRIEAGTLTVILDDTRHTLTVGQTLMIPQGSLHAMANLMDGDCVVFERQEGICREADISRFHDAYGRSVDPLPAGDKALGSLVLYKQTLADLKSS